MNLFYPSHDIALSNGVKHFNPPKAAQMLQEDLAWLEEIFSTPGPKYSTFPYQPWGWDWDTRQYLHREKHIPLSQLPNDAELEAIRQLSNRRTTIQILKALRFDKKVPEYLSSESELDAFVKDATDNGYDFILKTPWSNSGRGLIRSSNTPPNVLRQRALSTISKMGGIMAERWFNKQQDFAMLFYVGHQEVSFLGYSLFDNEESGTYRQGYLMSNGDIEKRLGQQEQLRQLSQQLIDLFNHLFRPFFGRPWCIGYIGVDMMILEDSSIHPCVELNLRCTMGIVARLWADRHLPEGKTGRFIISPMGKDGHFQAQFLTD